MLKPMVKNYNVKEQECGFDFRSVYAQVCELQGKQREEELGKLKQLQQKANENVIVCNDLDVEIILDVVNSATPIVRERIETRQVAGEEVDFHVHTTVFNSQQVVVNVDDELVLRLSKRYFRLQVTNLETHEIRITGNTHYKLYVNDVLHKIDTETVPDSTIDGQDKDYTVNFHGEQLFRNMLEQQINFR